MLAVVRASPILLRNSQKRSLGRHGLGPRRCKQLPQPVLQRARIFQRIPGEDADGAEPCMPVTVT